jgi:hypothetical protein
MSGAVILSGGCALCSKVVRRIRARVSPAFAVGIAQLGRLPAGGFTEDESVPWSRHWRVRASI